jgi:hypothetical protein
MALLKDLNLAIFCGRIGTPDTNLRRDALLVELCESLAVRRTNLIP